MDKAISQKPLVHSAQAWQLLISPTVNWTVQGRKKGQSILILNVTALIKVSVNYGSVTCNSLLACCLKFLCCFFSSKTKTSDDIRTLKNKSSFFSNAQVALQLTHKSKTKQVWRINACFYAVCSTEMRLAFTFWHQWELSDGSHCTQHYKAMVSSVLVLKNLYCRVLDSLCHTDFQIHVQSLACKASSSWTPVMKTRQQTALALSAGEGMIRKKKGEKMREEFTFLYFVELQKTEEEKKLERKKIKFRRRGYFSEK